MKVALLTVYDEQIDAVFMFKFLHHVPIELMGLLMRKIKQVLEQGMVSLCAPKDFIIR